MKTRITWHLLAVLILALFGGSVVQAADGPEMTVLNPQGIPPATQLVPMAPRLATLEGKTVYFVDDGFVNADVLLHEMMAWFNRNMPSVKTVYRKKGGFGFAAEDPKLWAEIGEKADAVIMGMGH